MILSRFINTQHDFRWTAPYLFQRSVQINFKLRILFIFAYCQIKEVQYPFYIVPKSSTYTMYYKYVSRAQSKSIKGTRFMVKKMYKCKNKFFNLRKTAYIIVPN